MNGVGIDRWTIQLRSIQSCIARAFAQVVNWKSMKPLSSRQPAMLKCSLDAAMRLTMASISRPSPLCDTIWWSEQETAVVPKKYALKAPVLRDGQYVYEIEPACPREHIEALAKDALKRFGGMDQFGFALKIAIDQDGNTKEFADLAFKQNVNHDTRDEVVAYVKAHINIK
jgi:hypothetical protein